MWGGISGGWEQQGLGGQHDPPSPFCSISVLDYPYCVVHELPELTAESLVSCSLLSQALGRLQGSSTQPWHPQHARAWLLRHWGVWGW